jgi:hypothetical protein
MAGSGPAMTLDRDEIQTSSFPGMTNSRSINMLTVMLRRYPGIHAAARTVGLSGRWDDLATS